MPRLGVPFVVTVQLSIIVPLSPSLTSTATPGDAPRSVILLTNTPLAVILTAGDVVAVMDGGITFVALSIKFDLLMVTGL